MKAKKMILSLLAVAAMALTLTACNDDDNDTWEKASSAQITAKATQIRSYLTPSGKFYYKRYTANKMDSVQNRLALTMPNDTTIMVYNIPNTVFASAIDSTTAEGLKLKHAVMNATEKTVNLNIRLAYFTYSGDNSTYCFLTPRDVTFTIPYSSTTASDKITFSFWLNQYQAAWDSNKVLVLQGLLAGYTLNKGSFQQFSNPTYCFVYCK
ncbi:DUF4840 domain-containing protein [Prevotella sp. AGR2160]|uniref:DUF4840 domain-containing protein n=1 Tax=Prevotella sp. AGR2160 TaxID=1280674 RepID=UPI0003FC4B35|nr:DUF4840 domain-containing protein [Prevotella sp. AGR2160]